MSQKNLAVFISGQGSNLEVFLQNKDKFRDILVVSSNEKAYGLERAKNHNVESIVLSRPIDWKDVHQQLLSRKIHMVFLAGFMRIVPASFIENWSGSLFNLHPSKLPHFKGLNAIERAYEAGADVGVTIHHVTPEVDAGRAVLQDIAVYSQDLTTMTLEEVIAETHKKEHQLVQLWIDQNHSL